MSSRELFLSSVSYEFRRVARYLYELLSRICFWNWKIKEFPIKANSFNSLLYLGRRSRETSAMMILGVWHNSVKKIVDHEHRVKRRVIVSELPFPDAICVPNYLSHVLPIDRPLDELIGNIGSDKLKFYQKNRASYRVEKIVADQEINQIDQTMLRSFATHRYGEWALQLKLSKVKSIALKQGTLNVIYFNEQKVACSLGSSMSRNGKSIWRGERAGFPENVYTHSKTFNEINTMNYFLEIEWACQHGYDFYEIGVSLARPEDNVLQWKRRLRGHLDTMGNYNYFYIRPPKENACDFFWETPLFGLENGKICLHLGKPDDKTDDEFIIRYRSMGFGGLSTIYIHCDRAPSQPALTRIANLYNHFEKPPNIKIISKQ